MIKLINRSDLFSPRFSFKNVIIIIIFLFFVFFVCCFCFFPFSPKFSKKG